MLFFAICLNLPASSVEAAHQEKTTTKADNASIERKSKLSKTVTISVRHADLAEVFEMMSKHGRVNILLANGVKGEVSINLYEIELHEAIKAVAIAAGFAVEKSGNTYFVVTRDDAGKEIVDGLTQVKSFKVQYSEPSVVATILSDHLSRYGKITALPERRLIVVEDIPEFMLRIEGLLEELDSQPVQIMIEAKILEVKLNRTETYGIDWDRMFSVGGGEFSTSGLDGPTSGLFFSLTNSNVSLALSALSSKGRVRTLSTPKLLALEHQEAEVVIGERTGYRETTTNLNGLSTETIKFLDSGVILRVTPFVDRNGMIMMQIHPEVSNTTLRESEIPDQLTTEVTTQLLAADGETIFIGGLIKNNTSETRNGIPILSDIPILGYAFRDQNDTVTNTETVVMITPRIVKSGMSRSYPDELEDKSRIQNIDLKLDKEGSDIEKVFKNHEPLGKKLAPSRL